MHMFHLAKGQSGRRTTTPTTTPGSTPGFHRRRWSAAATTALVVGSLGAFAAPASAALSSAGPIDPASLFPSYYADSNGLQLQMCQDGLPNCLAGPDQIQDVHAAGGDAEAFYFHAEAEVGPFLVQSALEAAYLADGPDNEVTFQRFQTTAKDVTPNGTWTITDPFRTYTCTADASGLVQPSKGCRFETNPIPGDFNAALSGPQAKLGPFLTWDTFGLSPADGGPPAGFIGDNTTPHRVVGSPTGFNKVRVQGPGIAGTCTEPDGTVLDNCAETAQIIVQGKVQPGGSTAALSAGTLDFGDIPGTPPVTKRLTYANTGNADITIGSVGITGTGAAAFSVANNCPAVVAVGTRCTMDVTFTPDPGKSSAATLTVTDDTTVGSRSVALKGSNLGVMFVSDPLAGMAFGSVPTGTVSPEDNAVIGNSGNGPLTISTVAITGTSAAQFKLGPSQGCTGVTVAPDGGCEIGVQFAPTTTGSKTANLRVTDSNGNIVNVPLTGTGQAVTAPGSPTIGTATAGDASADVSWTAPTTGGAPTSYTVRGFANGAATASITVTVVAPASSLTVTGLTNGTSYRFSVAATNSAGSSAPSALTNSVTPNPPAPGAPVIGTAVDGAKGGAITATANWSEPTTGGAPAGYIVRAIRISNQGAVLSTTTSTVQPATARSLEMTLPQRGDYEFTVQAQNGGGAGPESARSNLVGGQ